MYFLAVPAENFNNYYNCIATWYINVLSFIIQTAIIGTIL